MMKIEKNFTTGVLSGICGILVLVVMMGSTTPETTTKFEFHDLGEQKVKNTKVHAVDITLDGTAKRKLSQSQ